MNFTVSLACFFCGVDSRVLLYFFLMFVFSVVLASVAFLLWAMTKGDFKNVEEAKYAIFEDPEAAGGQNVPVPAIRNEPKESHERQS
ncbi:MAG TPA: hypothetical protein VK968_17845 [Roseimicrobium sp.]|nr:hypothetical protein [Roseimicrobium sp.]